VARSGVRKKGKGLDDMASELRRIERVLTEESVLRELADFLRAEAARLLRDPATFDFSTEPKWRARKAAVHGPRYAQLPLVVEQGTLEASLTDKGHPEHIEELTADGGLRLGSKVDLADQLLNRGGTNPLGEPFPARDPYEQIPRARVEVELRRLQLPRLRRAAPTARVT
jgi:hypothetical protein